MSWRFARLRRLRLRPLRLPLERLHVDVDADRGEVGLDDRGGQRLVRVAVRERQRQRQLLAAAAVAGLPSGATWPSSMFCW